MAGDLTVITAAMMNTSKTMALAAAPRENLAAIIIPSAKSFDRYSPLPLGLSITHKFIKP
jgi:hypothetical protein